MHIGTRLAHGVLFAHLRLFLCATQNTKHEGDAIAVAPKEDVNSQFSQSTFV